MNPRRPANLLDRYTHGRDAEFRKIPFVRSAIHRFRYLARHGVETLSDLISVYPDLSGRDREFAVWTMGIMDDRRSVPLLIRIYKAEPKLRGPAATALGLLGGKRAYEFAVRSLRETLCTSAVEDRDLRAAVFAVVHMPSEHERLLQDPDEPVLLLVDLLRRSELMPWARGEAASGLGHILESSDKRRRRWRIAVAAILGALSDDEPYVRHEAAHAAGDLRLEAARLRLTKMARQDKGQCGWGSVAREARCALHAIAHGDWPDWWWENGEPSP